MVVFSGHHRLDRTCCRQRRRWNSKVPVRSGKSWPTLNFPRSFYRSTFSSLGDDEHAGCNTTARQRPGRFVGCRAWPPCPLSSPGSSALGPCRWLPGPQSLLITDVTQSSFYSSWIPSGFPTNTTTAPHCTGDRTGSQRRAEKTVGQTLRATSRFSSSISLSACHGQTQTIEAMASTDYRRTPGLSDMRKLAGRAELDASIINQCFLQGRRQPAGPENVTASPYVVQAGDAGDKSAGDSTKLMG